MVKQNNHLSNKVEVYIDGQFFFWLQKQTLGWFVDPSLLLEWIEEELGTISNAMYYHRLNPEGNKEAGFLRALYGMGFQVITRPYREYFAADGSDPSLTGEIAIEMVGRAPLYDHAVLIGNDRLYTHALRRLHNNNKLYTVFGSPTNVDEELLAFCGQNFIDFDDEDMNMKDKVFKEQR